MAKKVWKKQKRKDWDEWKSDNKELRIVERYTKNRYKPTHYSVYVFYGNNDYPAINKRFKSKSKALKYAKAYMMIKH